MSAFLLPQVEELYKKAHANIRADPASLPKKTKEASVVHTFLKIDFFVLLLQQEIF